VLAFLLRHGRRYPGKSPWTKAHFGWLAEQKFGSPSQQIVFQEYLNAMESMSHRIDSVDRQLTEMSKHPIFKDVVTSLMALRGVQQVTALSIIAELGDIKRFDSAPQLMAYLGLVPSEHSSGGSRNRGGITKTGNSHLRRLLIESAWSYRFPARKHEHLSSVLRVPQRRYRRLPGKHRSGSVVAITHFKQRGKNKLQACTAIARELSGFIWAIGQSCPSYLAS